MTTAEALASNGFELTDTGGGVVQWMKTAEHGYQVVTGADGDQPRELHAPALAGTYDESSNTVEVQEFASLSDFLKS